MCDFSVLFSGPTPIHAPRPPPITYSIGIGTSDFRAESADASTQGGPPLLEVNSFLQNLSLGAVSSPVAGAPLSVLSPNFQRYLDLSTAPRSPPPLRVVVCRGTSTSDVVQLSEVAVNAVFDCDDKAVQAVMGSLDASTEYCPPVETVCMASLSVPAPRDSLDVDAAVSGFCSPASLESSVDSPGDFTVDGSLAALSVSEAGKSVSETGPEETSPMGPSLVDSAILNFPVFSSTFVRF